MFLKKRALIRDLKNNLSLKILLFVFISSAAINISKTYFISLKSSTYSSIENKKMLLSDEVSYLNYLVAKNSSLQVIEEKAGKLGLLKNNKNSTILNSNLALKLEHEKNFN